MDVLNERDSMMLFKSFATRSLYFGRIWNGMQRYAVKHEALPQAANPKRGAQKANIIQTINNDLDLLSNQQIVQTLDRIRTDYNQTRKFSEEQWQKWLKNAQAQLQVQQENIKRIMKQRKEEAKEQQQEREQPEVDNRSSDESEKLSDLIQTELQKAIQQTF